MLYLIPDRANELEVFDQFEEAIITCYIASRTSTLLSYDWSLLCLLSVLSFVNPSSGLVKIYKISIPVAISTLRHLD